MKIVNTRLPSVKYMLNKIKGWAEHVSKLYGISKFWIFCNYIWSALIYGCTAQDYFLYKFYLLNRNGKKRFVTCIQGDKYENAHTNTEFLPYINDKEKSLVKFGEFMQRDWCGQACHNLPEDYKAFAEKHDRAIVKPHDTYGGHGIRIVSTASVDGKDLYSFCKDNNMIVEELIVQHDDLNRMYSKSVNTIRIVTNNGECIGASLRMGTGGGEVDNASSGGIYAEVDVDTGIVVSKGHTHKDKCFLKHPDSGVIIPGFQIPLWDDCLKMVHEAGKLIENISLIGWDVAVTESGPTLVELNVQPGLELIQSPNGRGVREILK